MTRPLPHTTNQIHLTDAGFETWLLFHKGFELPYFAAFPLLRDDEGRAAMRDYFASFIELARQNKAGYVLDTNTWRANPDWAGLMGYSRDDLAAFNRESVDFAAELRNDFGEGLSVLINGVIGPRCDGYDPKTIMSIEEAQDYHAFQIGVFAQTQADMVSAITMTNSNEAIGIARAAGELHVPCVISFTLETDGNLPTGQFLAEAIRETDAQSPVKPAYYMINCAHPDHFWSVLEEGGDWINRIQGVRANASRMSHAELDACEVLDEGNPQELGQLYADMRKLLPRLTVFGGCCGTDHRHVASVCNALHGRQAA